jgi:quinol monooxygenase YgiN
MVDKQITVLANIKSKSDKLEQTIEELNKLVIATKKESGCIAYELHKSISEPNEFMFYEIWKDMESLEKHRKSMHILEFAKSRSEFLEENPKVTLWKLKN